MTASERPLRADAARNRQAILDAATGVFALQGSNVTLEHIAEVAGVGVGTIYRRFRSVDELLAAALKAKMAAYADEAERAVELAQSEPWDAFSGFVLFMLEEQSKDLAFSEVLLAPGIGPEGLRTEGRRSLIATRALVETAKTAGVLRDDFDTSDLYLLMHAGAGLVRGTQRSAPTAWKRFGQYMLDAFRASGSQLEPPSTTWMRVENAGQ